MSFSVQKILLKADQHIKNKEFKKAEALYIKILSKFPKNLKALTAIRILNLENKDNLLEVTKNEHLKKLIQYYNMKQFSKVFIKTKDLIKIYPNEINFYNILGASNAAIFDYDNAIKNYEKITKINPKFANAYFNLGVMFQAKNYFQKSIANYEKAIFLNPNYADAYNNMGNSLKELGKLDEALKAYEKTLSLVPNHAFAYNNIGNILAELGNRKESINAFEKALSINPNYPSALAAKLHQLSHVCAWKEIEKYNSKISDIGIDNDIVTPHFMLSLEDSPERHRLRSENFIKDKYNQNYLPKRNIPQKKPKRIRIGYVSSDFKEHPVSYLIAKVLESHNKNEFEVYGYSISQIQNDNIHKRLVKSFEVFKVLNKKNDEDAALTIQKDKIDILIDLNGYTENSRPGIFAYRPSNIQINYLGYPGTMGSNFIDYIIADPVLIPNDFNHFYTESIIRMPNSYMPTDNTRIISNENLSRSEFGLPENGIVFCCFNNNYKITADEFNIWMRILIKNKKSVLWLKKSNKWSKENIQLAAKERGVNPKRIIFAEKLPIEKHLASYKLADIFIDTFSYNAHTTATEALWAGLPVITKIGKGFAARVAGSLLSALDLKELITASEIEYENLIKKLASDPIELNKIKQKLDRNKLSSPLFNSTEYTLHLENAFVKIYKNYFKGENPKNIDVISNEANNV